MTRHRLFIFLATLVLSVFSTALFAEAIAERTPWDIGVKLGTSFGTLNQQGTSPGSPLPGISSFQGVPFGVAANFDVSRSLSIAGEFQFVADLSLFQITRQSVDVALAYHLLGGSRRTEVDYGQYIEVVKDPYDFSLCLRMGFYHYGASDPNNASAGFSGETLSSDIGLSYRYDLSDSVAIDLEVYTTLFNISASSERLSVNVHDFLLNFRFLL